MTKVSMIANTSIILRTGGLGVIRYIRRKNAIATIVQGSTSDAVVIQLLKSRRNHVLSVAECESPKASTPPITGMAWYSSGSDTVESTTCTSDEMSSFATSDQSENEAESILDGLYIVVARGEIDSAADRTYDLFHSELKSDRKE